MWESKGDRDKNMGGTEVKRVRARKETGSPKLPNMKERNENKWRTGTCTRR